MPVTFDRSVKPGVIRLEGEVDIPQAEELKRVLVEALSGRQSVRVAMEGVTGVDITAIQLLWAAEREARTAGVDLRLEGKAPETVRSLLREAGFDRMPLEDEPEPAGVQ